MSHRAIIARIIGVIVLLTFIHTRRSYTVESPLTIEQVTFYSKESGNSTKKIARRGVIVRHPNARATLVVSHGFTCNRFDGGVLCALFNRRECPLNFMSFDFRAHGTDVDEEQCCTLGHDEAFDVLGAVEFLKSDPELSKLPRIGYGFSMGAVAELQAQSQDKSAFVAIIADCPFKSNLDIIRRGLARLKFSIFGYEFTIPGTSILERYAFHPYVQPILRALFKAFANMDTRDINTRLSPVSALDAVKKIRVPLLFIACKNDETVPASDVQDIYANAPGYKRLWITNGRRHFDSLFYNPETYINRVLTFIDTVLDKKYLHEPRTGELYDPDEPKLSVRGRGQWHARVGR